MVDQVIEYRTPLPTKMTLFTLTPPPAPHPKALNVTELPVREEMSSRILGGDNFPSFPFLKPTSASHERFVLQPRSLNFNRSLNEVDVVEDESELVLGRDPGLSHGSLYNSKASALFDEVGFLQVLGRADERLRENATGVMPRRNSRSALSA